MSSISHPSVPQSPEFHWKWRGQRWRKAIIAFGIIALIGSRAIGYFTESYKWGSGFVVIMLLAVGIFAFSTEREWSLKKRVLWLCELPVIYFCLQFIPFGMITGLLRLPIGNDVIGAMMLALLTMRRSTWFVEPGDPVLPDEESFNHDSDEKKSMAGSLNEDASHLTGILSGRAENLGGLSEGEWHQLIELAVKNGVSQMLYSAVKREGLMAPPLAAERIRNIHLASVVNNTKRVYELEKIFKAFSDVGITVVPVKGAWLGEAVYGNIAMRGMADMDLWLQRKEIDAARNVMFSLGYAQNSSRTARPQALQDALLGESSLFKRDAPVVELHWKIFAGEWLYHAARIDREVIWHRTLPYRGDTVRQLSVEDALIYIAIHLSVRHQMSESALRTLLDLDTARKKLKVEWEIVAGRSQEWQVATAMWLVLSMLERLFGDPQQELPLHKLQPSFFRQWVLGRFITPQGLVDGLHIKGLQRFWFLLALVDKPLDALKLLWRGVVPDRKWLELRYGLQDAPRWRVCLQRLWHPLLIVLHRDI